MQLPRENRLVRLYIQLRNDDELGRQAIQNGDDDATPKRLLQIAQRTYEPYRMDYKRCDWWSLYHVRQCTYEQRTSLMFADRAAVSSGV